MIKTIFFDLDDTLINDREAARIAAEEVRKIFFPKENSERFHSVWKEKTLKYLKQYALKKLTFHEQRIKRLQSIWREYQKNLSPKEAETIFYKEFLPLYEKNWQTFKNTISILKKLRARKISIGIISNGSTKQQYEKIRRLNLDLYTNPELILISEEVGYNKPDKRIFLLAQKLAKNKADEILFIGDSIYADIIPAHALGWNVIFIDHFNEFPSTKYKRITSLEKILELVSMDYMLN